MQIEYYLMWILYYSLSRFCIDYYVTIITFPSLRNNHCVKIFTQRSLVYNHYVMIILYWLLFCVKLQRLRYRAWPLMIAIKNTVRTKYGCNHKSKAEHIWFQSVSIRTKHDSKVESWPGVTWLWFLNESHENKFSIIAIIFGPYLKELQSYMVRFELVIAIIFSPYCDEDCNHIWSPSSKILQSWVVQLYIT